MLLPLRPLVGDRDADRAAAVQQNAVSLGSLDLSAHLMTYSKRVKRGSQTISAAEIRDALSRSGYLLESRIASVLRSNDFEVVTNTAYPDPLTGKTRELDIQAEYKRIMPIGPDPDDMLLPAFLIECVNPPQPIAFIAYPRPNDFTSALRPLDCIRILGTPRHDPDNENGGWSWLPSVARFSDTHHYGTGVLSTQFCSFEQKRGSTEWMAKHRDEDHEAFGKLTAALDFYTLDFYRTMYDPKVVATSLQLTAVYPVLVVEGDLYQVRQQRRTISIRKSGHVRYYRTTINNGEQVPYLIDVVTEKYFSRYLATIGREIERMGEAISARREEVNEVLRTWLLERQRKRGDSANPTAS